MADDEPTQAVVPVAHEITIFGTDEPAGIVQRVSAVATPLAAFIRERQMATSIQGRDYVLAEGWAFMGAMLGVHPVTTKITELRDADGRLVGFEAHVELRTRDGALVGGAIAECSRYERNWQDRDDFALKSMAQTRATGKAYRMSLGFVMKAAGYEATPAEEMDTERVRTPTQQRPMHQPEPDSWHRGATDFLAAAKQRLGLDEESVYTYLDLTGVDALIKSAKDVGWEKLAEELKAARMEAGRP